MELVPLHLVLLSPWAMRPNSLLNDVFHISLVTGALMSLRYWVMVSPVVGWMMGAQKCSMSTSRLLVPSLDGDDIRKDDGVHVSSFL